MSKQDLSGRDTRPRRPELVQEAMLMLYAASGINAIYLFFFMKELMDCVMDGSEAVLAMIFVSSVSVGIVALLSFLVGRGRAWARKALVGFVFLCLLVGAWGLIELYAVHLGFFINCALTFLLEVAACVMLSSKKVADWFAPKV